jgi:prepilin-type N-terminal cleavage/methylation domain-containing protein
MYARMLKKGFTLIELLIVVAIIAILAAIAVPNFLEAQTRAKVTQSIANCRNYITVLEAYRIDNKGALPPGPQVGAAWAPWTWRGYYAFALTTPVAYMTSAVQDNLYRSFNSAGPDAFYEYHLLDNNIFRAVAEKGHAPGMWTSVDYMSDSDRGIFREARAAIFTAWGHDNASLVIYGRGPMGRTVYTNAQIHYDPSNGTVSPGEVLLFN